MIAKGAQNTSNKEFYIPPQITVKPGSTITWKNEDTAIHTATSGKDATPDGKFDTSLISPGQSSKPTTMPNEPGQYSYLCTLHPHMTGTVIVK
jgi:plastocyanin